MIKIEIKIGSFPSEKTINYRATKWPKQVATGVSLW